MARTLDPATREALAERMRFYRELGLTDFYRRPVDAAVAEQETGAVPGVAEGAGEREADGAERGQEAPAPEIQSNFFGEEPAIKTRKGFHAPEIGVAIPVEERAAALRRFARIWANARAAHCTKARNKIVFGVGNPAARLMFVGEGPGADEDAQGLPFVGRAGQLLNNMITAMGLKREECYIANVVKCRPPGNRTPEPDEANTCSPFLFRQIDVVRPQVLVALGATAATYLLGARQPLAALRGRVHAFRGMSLIVTYHPAFLLRDPRQKKEAWADLQIAMKELGLKKTGNRG